MTCLACLGEAFIRLGLIVRMLTDTQQPFSMQTRLSKGHRLG